MRQSRTLSGRDGRRYKAIYPVVACPSLTDPLTSPPHLHSFSALNNREISQVPPTATNCVFFILALACVRDKNINFWSCVSRIRGRLAQRGFFAISACAPVKEETSFFPHTSKAERLGLGTMHPFGKLVVLVPETVSKTRIPLNTYVPRQSPLEPHKQRPVHALPCCARVVVPRTDLDRGGGCCFRQKPWRLSLWGDQGPLAKRVE